MWPLTLSTMGVLALAILWVNTLLVAGAAWIDMRGLRRLARRLTPVAAADLTPGSARLGLVRGRPEGPDALAAHELDQVGRLTDTTPPHILWHDKAYRSLVTGGRLRIGGASIEVRGADNGWVWPDPSLLRAEAAATTAETFDAHLPNAKKARGTLRTVRTAIDREADVWVFGTLTKHDDGSLSIGPPDAEDRWPGPSVLVSLVDPRAFCRGKIALLAIFIGVTLAVAALCTAAALVPPAFGTVSTIGAAACLAYFLLVQPAGVSVREAVRTPDRVIVRGRWIRASAGDPASAPDSRARSGKLGVT